MNSIKNLFTNNDLKKNITVEKYDILRRYLILWFKDHMTMTKSDVEIILQAIDVKEVSMPYVPNIIDRIEEIIPDEKFSYISKGDLNE